MRGLGFEYVRCPKCFKMLFEEESAKGKITCRYCKTVINIRDIDWKSHAVKGKESGSDEIRGGN